MPLLTYQCPKCGNEVITEPLKFLRATHRFEYYHCVCDHCNFNCEVELEKTRYVKETLETNNLPPFYQKYTNFKPPNLN